MNPFKAFTTPEYLFRPQQILHRFKRAFRRAPLPEFETIELPWGGVIRVRPAEVIGANIWCYGVFDLVVAEAIWRLLDPAETGLDIGANIGQMTNLMSHRAGQAGRVISFEPHPELFSELEFNCRHLEQGRDVGSVDLHQVALSDAAGAAYLDIGQAWSLNRGVAKLATQASSASNGLVPVNTRKLDDVIEELSKIGVTKIDVEGHELEVLGGAARLLAGRHLRDIVFEDLGQYPSPVHRLLIDRGFTLFSLHTRVWGIHLVPAVDRAVFKPLRDGQNYLATLEPTRALRRFQPLGWQVLRKRRSS